MAGAPAARPAAYDLTGRTAAGAPTDAIAIGLANPRPTD
jgi:hypothetical protein